MAIRRRRRTKSLAAQTFELGMAAPQVIAHRMARMAAAGTPLSARDRAEFQRMSIEKLAAVNEAWTAIAGQAFYRKPEFRPDADAIAVLPLDASGADGQVHVKALEQGRGKHPRQGNGAASSSRGGKREAPAPHQVAVMKR